VLQLAQIQSIQAQLRKVPALVDAQQARDSRFPALVVTWLRDSEAAMEAARLHAVGKVAAVRSRLLTSLHGGSIEGGERKGRIRHKQREAEGSMAIAEAQRVMSGAINKRLEQVAEARDIAMRIVAVARVKGYIEKAAGLRGHQASLEFLQQALSADSDTAAALVHMTGILGPVDSLVVLDQSLPELVPDERMQAN